MTQHSTAHSDCRLVLLLCQYHDNKSDQWIVVLNKPSGGCKAKPYPFIARRFQDLKLVLHETLKPVQGDMAKYLKTFQQNIFCTFNLARILIYG